jgi:hypothetical protein
MRKLLVAAALSAGLLLPAAAMADDDFGCNDIINFLAGPPSEPNPFGLSPKDYAQYRNFVRQALCHDKLLYQNPD